MKKLLVMSSVLSLVTGVFAEGTLSEDGKLLTFDAAAGVTNESSEVIADTVTTITKTGEGGYRYSGAITHRPSIRNEAGDLILCGKD